MDGMVEENGTSGSVDALVSQGTGSPIVVTSVCRTHKPSIIIIVGIILH